MQRFTNKRKTSLFFLFCSIIDITNNKRGGFNEKFVSGILVGSLATAAAVAGLVVSVKKTVIDPIDEKEAMIEENRKKQCVNAFLVNNYLKIRMKTF